jgi:LPS-assembly protein
VRVLRAAPVLFLATPLLAQIPSGSFDTSNDPFAARFHERTQFHLSLKKPAAGGQAKITARAQNCEEQMTICQAEGDVTVEYQDIKIQADKITFDRETFLGTAEGHVIMDQGPTRISGQRARFNLKAKTGTVEEAQADLQPAFHIIGKEISKVGEVTYEVIDGIFTACRVPDPAWSFAMSRAEITLDDYAHLYNTSFRAGHVPLLYSPYILWPTKEDRVSGFLVPGIGYNNTRGAFLGLTYYWVTGRATDSTTALDLYSKGTVGLAEEFRWTPSPESAGLFQGFVARDRQASVCVPGTPTNADQTCLLPDGTLGVLSTEVATRWKLRLDHVSDDLPWDMRGVVSLRRYSDFQYLQDFERTYLATTAAAVPSFAFLTKNFGADSLNLRFERTESFVLSEQIVERTPSLEFAHRPSEIGSSPLYAALEASFSRLFMNRGAGGAHGGYNRADLFPVLSIPLKGIPWLSFTARGGYRLTYYSDSFTPPAQSVSFSGESLTRHFWEGGASLVGPSFSKIYEFTLGPFVKWKHVIEPRVTYDYRQDVADFAEVPTFDEVDLQAGQNTIQYALVNRLLAKRGGENAPAAQEVASLELSQTYNFTLPETVTQAGTIPLPLEKRGPAQAILRVSPVPEFHLDGTVGYDTSFSKLTSYTFSAFLIHNDESAEFSWNALRPIVPAGAVAPPGGFDTDFIRAGLGVYLFSKKWRFDTQLNYSVQQHQMTDARSLLTYNGSCYTIFLEYLNVRAGFGTPARNEVRVVVNLKNIGTLLDLNGGLDKLF